MDAIPSNLCILIEQLEDARQFHAQAARDTAGLPRERHGAQSLAYASMLAEIRDWQSRKQRSSVAPGFGAAGADPGHANLDDSYFALLDRVYRIHRAAAPATHTIRARATDARHGSTTDGGRSAGECMPC